MLYRNPTFQPLERLMEHNSVPLLPQEETVRVMIGTNQINSYCAGRDRLLGFSLLRLLD